jgi:hypothetical protein
MAPHLSRLFTAAWISKIWQQEDGERACQAFVAGREEPLDVHMPDVTLSG